MDFEKPRSGEPVLMEAEKLERGVALPGVSPWLFALDLEEELGTACLAAWMRRLVVPRVFVEPLRAEQTMASLCWSRYFLQRC